MGNKTSKRELIFQSWRSFLKGDKIEVLRFIIFYIRSQQIFVYLSVISLLHFNWWSFAVIPLAFLVNLLLGQFFSQRQSYLKLQRVVEGIILTYEKEKPAAIQADKYLVSEYLEKDTYDFIDQNFLKKNVALLGLSWSLDDRLQVYHLHAKGLGITNYACYTVPPFRSYIFLLSSPREKNHALIKFIILHEIAHSALDTRSPEVFIQHSNKFFTIFSLLTILFFPWNMFPIWGGLGLFLLWCSSYLEKRTVLKKHKLSDEISDDELAIEFMSPSEKRELLEDYFLHHSFPDTDPQFSDKDNAIRHAIRVEKLKFYVQGSYSETSLLLPDYKKIYFRTPIVVGVIQLALILGLSLYSNRAGGMTVIILLIASLILVFCSYQVLSLTASCEAWIKNRLKSWEGAIFR